jgi:TonB family protein
MAEMLTASPTAHAIGLALVHFLWQGALLGAAGAALFAAFGRSSAQSRYVIGCAVLAAMMAAFAFTYVVYARHYLSIPVPGPSAIPATPANVVTEVPPQTLWSPTAASWLIAAAWVEARWQAAVLIWSAGVVLLSLHLLRGWLLVKRMRRSGAEPAADWMPQVRRLASRLGIRRRLRLLESAWIEVPSVIGWIRPVILVPASALAGLPPAQFEAILAHELAHVRRHDYLVNVLQSVIEVLLFYHPAVWWISRRVRLEREHCCDDVAAEICGDRVAYAAALTSLEERRGATPAFAIGARDGDLLARVRRLVKGGDPAPRSFPGWAATASVVTVVVMALGAGGRNPVLARDAQPRVEVSSAIAEPPALESTNIKSLTPHVRPRTDPRPRTAADAHAPSGVSTLQSGTLVGVIVDQQGGRLPGARVLVASETRGAGTVADAAGRYAITGLPPGTYDVNVSLPGFRRSQDRVDIGVGEMRLNVQLEIGGVTETILVATGSSPGLAPVPTPPAAPLQPDPRAASDYVAQAKLYFEQGRSVEAEAMSMRAGELMNEQRAAKPVIVDPADQGPVRIGGSIKAPRKVHDVRPAYPAEAAAAGIQGLVIIEAVIGKDGSVTDARIVRTAPLLDEAALDAVRQWVFTPTLLNGVPVEVVMTVTVNFTGG